MPCHLIVLLIRHHFPLSHLYHQVAGYLTNMGQGLIFTVDNSSKPSVNLTGGPLSYKYEWHQMALHFGLNNQTGSEHTIAGRSFPAEVRNSDLMIFLIKKSLSDSTYTYTYVLLLPYCTCKPPTLLSSPYTY